MSKKENIDLARKLIDCFNKNNQDDLSSFDTLIDANVRFHDLSHPDTPRDLKAFKHHEQEYVKAFPDKKTKIDSIISTEDDQVVIRWTTHGTHKGIFKGSAPTGHEVKVSGISIWRFSNNKLVEGWQVWDRFGLVEQLGSIHADK